MVKTIIVISMLVIVSSTQARDITKPLLPEITNTSTNNIIIEQNTHSPYIQGVYVSKTIKKVLINDVWMEESDKFENIKILTISKDSVKILVDNKVKVIRYKELK